jgi:hypothetical protein
MRGSNRVFIPFSFLCYKEEFFDRVVIGMSKSGSLYSPIMQSSPYAILPRIGTYRVYLRIGTYRV